MKAPIEKAAIYVIRLSSIGDVMIAARTVFLLSKVLDKKIIFISGDPCVKTLSRYIKDVDIIGYKSLTDSFFEAPAAAIIDLQNNAKSRKIIKRIPKASDTIIKKKNSQQLFRVQQILKARLSSHKNTRLDSDADFTQISLNNECARLAVMHFISEADFGNAEALSKLQIWPQENKNDLQGIRIAIAPGASFDSKKAPIKLFTQSIVNAVNLIRQEDNNKEIQIVLIGSKDDIQDCSDLAISLSGLINVLVDNRAGLYPLDETSDLISSCDVILTNDSSLGHISENFGVPSVVLFGPTSESFGFTPTLKASKSISVPIGCRPCSKHGKRKCRYSERYCFTRINPQTIATALYSICLSKDA